MKHRLILIIALAVMIVSGLTSVGIRAESLNVDSFFKEDFAKNPAVTMVSVSGRSSGWKGLSAYRSVSVAGDGEVADAIARAVRKDGVNAEFKETSFKDGRLSFGFYGLGGEGSHRRYLFFLDLRPKGKDKTTLIYIEGDWTPEQVKSIITKKAK
ncbi:MAG: hypothetical protein K2H72_05675 [Muribaculaceae bacterium]|nr:hypothetical protein [Muribaculaceae bacterium]